MQEIGCLLVDVVRYNRRTISKRQNGRGDQLSVFAERGFEMKGMRVSCVGGLVLALAVAVGCQSTPKRFSEWKTFELRKDLSGDYDRAWEAIVETVHRRWGIEKRNRDLGYIETGWVYTETDMSDPDHRKRFVILLPTSATTFKIRSESQSRDRDNVGVHSTRWRPSKNRALHSSAYYDLVNEIGRTVLNE